jgi:predicted enzyme related to lactoylglutathione lyase
MVSGRRDRVYFLPFSLAAPDSRPYRQVGRLAKSKSSSNGAERHVGRPSVKLSTAVQVIFAVNDVTRSAAFYQGVFGWPRNELIDYREYVELHAPGGTLGLCERDTYASLTQATPMTPENGDVSPAYLYVRVPDVREAVAKREEAGARPLAPLAPRSWGDEAAWFADPDGNVVAVAQAASD